MSLLGQRGCSFEVLYHTLNDSQEHFFCARTFQSHKREAFDARRDALYRR